MKTRYRYNENPGGAVMSSHYVYVIVNKINLKLYFGSHTWDGEGLDKNYYGSGKIIKQAVKKYGKDNFIVYPIKFYDTIEECRQAEEELLKKYDISNNPYCYNIKNSAIGWDKGRPFSEKHKQKLSQALKGRTGEKSHMYGRTLSSETRNKMSKAKKGEKHPMYGRTVSENTRNKIAISKGGKPFVAIKDGKVKIFTSQHECSRVLGLNQQSISKCLKGRRNHTGGYTFKYVEELESGIYEGML